MSAVGTVPPHAPANVPFSAPISVLLVTDLFPQLSLFDQFDLCSDLGGMEDGIARGGGTPPGAVMVTEAV